MTTDAELTSGNIRRSKPFFDGKLLKRVLMDLPTGLILLSNVEDELCTPCVEVVLGPPETRDSLWLEMRRRRVDGRTFLGFLDREGLRIEKEERLQASPAPAGIQ
jgi:hypothetical protein